MRRPPRSVAFIAWTHAMMSLAIGGFVAALHFILRDSRALELSRTTYVLTLGLATLYAVTAVLVWCGLPLGRVLNRVCSVFYFVRPPLGMKVAAIIRSDEYRAHFERGPRTASPPPP